VSTTPRKALATIDPRVIAIGQAWVAAEAAVLSRGAGIEMTVRTLPGAGAVASWYDRVDGEGDRLPSEPTPEAALLALAAALAAEPRGSSGVVEQSATQRKHEYHSERTDFDFWCIASCHDDGRCDGECDPDCESCPIPCPLCEAAAPTPPPADESAERHEWEGMASYPECSCGWRGHAGSHDYGVSQHKEHVAAARKEGHRE
jgi:hypothetical protein